MENWSVCVIWICLGCLLHHAMCQEFSQCYNDICFWTDGSNLTQAEAQAACQRRDNSFLPRITNYRVQTLLRQFRLTAGNFLDPDGWWIGVRAVNISDFHWVDGSSFAGLFYSLQCSNWHINHQLSQCHTFMQNCKGVNLSQTLRGSAGQAPNKPIGSPPACGRFSLPFTGRVPSLWFWTSISKWRILELMALLLAMQRTEWSVHLL